VNLKVDHVAIAVHDMTAAVRLFHDTLGGRFLTGGDYDDTGMRILHLALPGSKLELLQPLRSDSALQAHLDRRGPGFHHMTLFVDDLASSITVLEGSGFPVTGVDLSSPGWREAFLNPKASFGALLQFAETDRSWDEPTPGITLEDVLAGRVVWRDLVACLRSS
jgi:methylmalonyl-CoA/ethylmalonyl-CoA epimerase